jgi:hypothetical protein
LSSSLASGQETVRLPFKSKEEKKRRRKKKNGTEFDVK